VRVAVVQQRNAKQGLTGCHVLRTRTILLPRRDLFVGPEHAQRVEPRHPLHILLAPSPPQQLGDQVGKLGQSSSPTGTSVIPSKSEPSPTWSMPATWRMCSMWSATWASVAFGARAAAD